jgi:hypothetical protein
LEVIMTATAPPGSSADVPGLAEEVTPAHEAGVRVDRADGGVRRWWPAVVCLSLYIVLAGLDFGSVQSLGSGTMTGPRNADQIAQVWWLAWAHFALTHGHGLFFTDWQNYPVGLNFGMNGSLFALGVLFAPVTATFGPVVTWNVLLRLALILSAFSMCLVLRRFTRWWPAAFAGGLLYGFSTYALFNAGGYLFLAFVPLPPLILLLLYEIVVRRTWRPIATGALLGLVCGAQYLISSEILASSILMGVIACGLYLLPNRKSVSLRNPYLKAASLSTLIAGALSLGFPVAFTFFGPQHAKGPPNSPANLAQLHSDLLGPFVPGSLQRLSTPHLRALWSQHLTNASMTYMGIPLFVAIIVIVYLLRRRGIVLLCGVMAALSIVLSLGSVLYVNGHDTHVPLPFVVLANLPITQGLLATRFSLFTFLFGAVVVAIGVEELHGKLVEGRGAERLSPRQRQFLAAASLLVVVAVALPMLPARTQSRSPVGESAFFSSTAATRIRTGDVVLAYPYPTAPFIPAGPDHSSVYTFAPVNNLLVDQAVSGMNFKLVGGYGWRPTKGTFGSPKPSRLSPPSVETLFDVAFSGVASPGQLKLLASSNLTADLRSFLHRYGVAAIIVVPLGHHPAVVINQVTEAIGSPSREAGTTVWFDVQHRLATAIRS